MGAPCSEDFYYASLCFVDKDTEAPFDNLAPKKWRVLPEKSIRDLLPGLSGKFWDAICEDLPDDETDKVC